MGWTGPLQPISKREARHRYRQGLLIGVGNETHHGAHTGYAFTAQDVDGVTFDELVERSTDGRRPYAVCWWRPADKPRRAEPRRAAVAEDQAAAGNTGVTPPPAAIATRLRAAADLAEGIANLTAAWDAAEDIDSTLGSEVERVGLWSIDVLHATAADIRETEPLRAAVLTRYAEELNNAVDAYADLPEHEVDHSLDIFDRLAPGVELVRHVLVVIGNPPAGERATVGEVTERLRQFPPALEVWVAAPHSEHGFLPLDGTAREGHDDAPGPHEPASFVVLGTKGRAG